MSKKLVAFRRLDDGEMFTLNDDGKTFSLERGKKDFPEHLHMEYTEIQLSQPKFFAPVLK